MKSITFFVTLTGIVLTTTFQSSCGPMSDQNSQMTSTYSADRPQYANEKQLLQQVESFASSDDQLSTSAWQTLQSYDRSKLIGDLTRISDASAPDDRNRVLIAFTFCNMAHEYSSNRTIVVSALARKPLFKDLFGDWAVNLVRRLMIKGDQDLLVVLFEVSDWSDGAMSLELAHAYSQALASKPEAFLELLSSQSETIRSRVLKLLKHNSLTEDEYTRVKSYLNHVSPESRLRQLAVQTVRALEN